MNREQYAEPPTLRALIWRSADGTMLLPAGAAVEVLRYTEPRPVAGAADYVLGQIDWRGRALPAVTLEPSGPGVGAVAAMRPRLLICVGPTGGLGADLFALVVAQQPRLVYIDAEDLTPPPPDASLAGLPFLLHIFGFRGEAAATPDLDGLEQALGAVGAS